MRATFVIGFLGLALCGAALAANPPSGPKKEDNQTNVPYAILIEAKTGTILYEKNADQLIPPASLAKLMTTEVVFNEIKEGNLSLDDEFVVSENAWRRGGAPSGGSTMFAALHSKIKVRDLLHGVIIQSANDGCIILAEGIAGNETDFARLMNGRAREIGLTQSNFTNSTGLPDKDMRVTVRELARLAQHLIATYPEFYSWYGEREFTWNKIRQQNRNPLLTNMTGADGLKTGYTAEAGYALVGSAVQNGMRLIVVLSGAKSDKERADEGKKLLEWGFHSFESRPLFADGQAIGDARVYGGTRSSVPLVASGPVDLLVPRNLTEKIVARIVYRGPVMAPVRKGQKIGLLRVWRGENVVLETQLEAGEDVGPGGMVGRAFDAARELVAGAVRAGVKKL
ncbi:MAG TPA: D-alanyl-D-alanine carboxypeptidase family protein [Pseudorhodoplanes sp.]|nr:D-alanyl-D-alanine carboxypeptidase family protein [Pseudorhodoplanes sp.]